MRAEQRLAWAVTGLSTFWLALVATWEIGGPPLAGHYAASASVGIAADNMLRWGIAGPVLDYLAQRPEPSAYYCHHPWGIFWTTAALLRVLGRHDLVCRLAPALLSAATPPLLYALGRAIWRPAAGAAAAAAFVVLPIALSFATLNALEVPVIAWSLLAAWGAVRLLQSGDRRFLAASAAGTLMALNADWPAFVFTSLLVAFAIARAGVLRRFFGPVAHPVALRAWWATSAALVVVTAAGYAALFARSGQLGELARIYSVRAAHADDVSTLAAVVARRTWIELSFTEVGLVLGIAGVGVQVARLAILRREHEVVPLAFLAMAAAQYLVFPEGADVHVFWPHYFAVTFALGVGALVATGASALEGRTRMAEPALAALGIALAALALVLRDAVPVLRYARETGGRFEEKGNFIESDGDKIAVLRWIAGRLPPGAPVAVGRGLRATWAEAWALGGRPVVFNVGAPRGGSGDAFAVWVSDSRRIPAVMQEKLATRFHVVAAGPIWIIDPGEPAAPLDAYAIEEHEPSAWQWCFVSATEPVRALVPDPFLTWELRAHLGQPAAPPRDPPASLEQKRVSYALALDAGDATAAAALLRDLRGALTPPATAPELLADGAEVLGTTRTAGVMPSVTVWLRAPDSPEPPDARLAAYSRVEGRAPLSFLVADPLVREVGPPLALEPGAWKAGWLYTDRIPLRKRPGVETFWVESVWPGVVAGGGKRVEVAREPESRR